MHSAAQDKTGLSYSTQCIFSINRYALHCDSDMQLCIRHCLYVFYGICKCSYLPWHNMVVAWRTDIFLLAQNYTVQLWISQVNKWTHENFGETLLELWPIGYRLAQNDRPPRLCLHHIRHHVSHFDAVHFVHYVQHGVTAPTDTVKRRYNNTQWSSTSGSVNSFKTRLGKHQAIGRMQMCGSADVIP